MLSEDAKYEIKEYFRINLFAECSKKISAWHFEYNGKTCVVIWHNLSEDKIFVPLVSGDFTYGNCPGINSEYSEKKQDGIILEVSGRMYFISDSPEADVIRAFEDAYIM